MSPALEFKDAQLVLGNRPVLDGISVAVAPGEFVGVLGPNGAGKTTLMRAALGLLTPWRGTIGLWGEPVRRGNPRVGYMPQTRATPAGLRLRGDTFVGAALGGWRPWLSRHERAVVDRALGHVGASDLARRPLRELSGGERQRVLLAQALLGEPRLLLLDEPLISLDPAAQHEVVALVRRLNRELGLTVLFSAHELNPLLGALDRVLYLGRGAAALGSVEEVITGPVLSRLYGAPVEVVRAAGRVFVMAGNVAAAHGAHMHEHA